MRFFITVFCLLLSACASTDYESYLTAQQAVIASTQAAQRPLFELEAEPGQPITGLKAVRVFMPAQAPVLQQSRPSEWASVLGNGLQILGVVAGIKYQGEAAANLANAVGSAANHGYQFVQSPQANQSIGGNGIFGSGAMSDSTHVPTVVEQPSPIVVEQPAPVIVQPLQP
jgi:uncharacterized lipoprotein YmbA